MANSRAASSAGIDHTVVFDRAASFYDETRGFPPGVAARMAAALAEQLPLTSHHSVLEIGVGTGRIALPLRPYVGFYAGVDLSRPMMEVLRQKGGGSVIALAQGDVTVLPFAPASFDLSIAIHVFHLVGGWRASVEELARVLRPGGAALVNTYDGPDEIVRRWRGILAAHGAGGRADAVGVRDNEAIATAFAAAGFSVREDGVAAEWPVESRPSETIEALANRIWSSTWNIPEPAFSRALADLRAWVRETYSDPAAPVKETARLRYMLFRRPAGS